MLNKNYFRTINGMRKCSASENGGLWNSTYSVIPKSTKNHTNTHAYRKGKNIKMLIMVLWLAGMRPFRMPFLMFSCSFQISLVNMYYYSNSKKNSNTVNSDSGLILKGWISFLNVSNVKGKFSVFFSWQSL